MSPPGRSGARCGELAEKATLAKGRLLTHRAAAQFRPGLGGTSMRPTWSSAWSESSTFTDLPRGLELFNHLTSFDRAPRPHVREAFVDGLMQSCPLFVVEVIATGVTIDSRDGAPQVIRVEVRVELRRASRRSVGGPRKSNHSSTLASERV